MKTPQNTTLVYSVNGRISVWQSERTSLPYGIGRISHLILEDELNTTANAFGMADCFDPSISIVHSDSFERAFDAWLTECEPNYQVEPDDKDYDEKARESLHYTDGGDAFDVECAQSRDATLLCIAHRNLDQSEIETLVSIFTK